MESVSATYSREAVTCTHLNGAVGNLSASCKRTQYEETALQVLNTIWLINTHSTTSEEVDDALLEHVGRLGFLALLVFFDRLLLDFTIGLCSAIAICLVLR